MAKLLVIDDEMLVAMALAAILEDAGHEVAQGRIGAGLQQDLELGDYALVVTDLNMPGMNGWDVAQWLGANRPGIPVIAISGRIVEDLDPVWVKSFAAVFTKPIDEPGLLRTIDRLLADR